MALLSERPAVLADGDLASRLSRCGTSRSHDGNIMARVARGWRVPLTAGRPAS